jgi:hypothetical protein
MHSADSAAAGCLCTLPVIVVAACSSLFGFGHGVEKQEKKERKKEANSVPKARLPFQI